MTDQLALAVTSSTGVMSVAVGPVGTSAVDGGQRAVVTTVETDRRHAEEITPLIVELAAKAGIALSDIDVLVVDRGPGRFTGLRVGLATVRALAFALDVGVIGLTSLEILAGNPAATGPAIDRDPGTGGAGNLATTGSTVTAVVDARRDEVFQQTFKSGRPVTEAVVGRPEHLVEAAAGVIVGDGLDRYLDVYGDAARPSDPAGSPSDPRIVRPGVLADAATMLALAVDRDPRSGRDVEPLYLRNPDVNPNVKTRPRA